LYGTENQGVEENRSKVASKRVKSDACIGFSEREQARRKIASIRAENRVNLSAEIWRRRKIAVPLHRDSKHRVPDAAFNNTHTRTRSSAICKKKTFRLLRIEKETKFAAENL
jgi:hypothetical protein